MTIQLRQICLVASNLAPTIEELTEILGINTCFIDPGVGVFGLENVLFPIGRNFLEVVAPTKQGTAAGRYLERRQGDGGYMVICQADSKPSQQELRQRALDSGVRIAHESDRQTWNICQLHPRDMIASFFEYDWDEQNDFNGNWQPAGGLGWEDKVKQDITVDYLGVELQSPDPVLLAEKWAQVLGVTIDRDGDKLSARLNNSTIRFVEASDGRGPGLSGIDLEVRDRSTILESAQSRQCYVSDQQVVICGTNFYLHDAD